LNTGRKIAFTITFFSGIKKLLNFGHAKSSLLIGDMHAIEIHVVETISSLQIVLIKTELYLI
jgi:hypothetical protein